MKTPIELSQQEIDDISLNIEKSLSSKIPETLTQSLLSDGNKENIRLAISQMILSGVVTEYSLLQLNHTVLPCVRIFADTVGVSTDDLFKMAVAREIIAKDTLPAFSLALANYCLELYPPKK